MFNAFNRSSVNAASSSMSTQNAEIIMHQHVSSSGGGGGRHSSKPLIGAASGTATTNNSRTSVTAAAVAMNNVMRDSNNNKSYNNYSAHSPQIDKNRFSRDVSPSPPSLGQLHRQTFFGSSFAGGVTAAINSNNPKSNSFSLSNLTKLRFS